MRIIKLFVLTLAVLLMLCGSSFATLDEDNDGRVDSDKIEEVDPRVDTHESTYPHSDIAHANRTALDAVEGVNTGDQSLADIVTLTLANDPYSLAWYYGPPATAGTCADTETTPSSQALASKAAKQSVGWPEANLRWLCIELETFTLIGVDAYSITVSDDGTMVFVGGVLTGVDAYSETFSDDGTIQNVTSGGGTLTGVDAYSLTYSDDGTMAFMGGLLTGVDAYSETYSDDGTMTEDAGGTPVEVTFYGTVYDNVIAVNGDPGASWASMHDSTGAGASLGSVNGTTNPLIVVYLDAEDGTGTIHRQFFQFDTSSIPDGATINSVDMKLTASSVTGSMTVSAQLGTQNTNPTAVDFDSFTGNYFGTVLVSSTGQKTIPFNAEGLAAISDTGLTKIVVRNYTYDYLNVIPPEGYVGYVTFYMQDHATQSYRPQLIINYTE
jgi:hypothetical protein